jgi:hypothetical protein
MMNEANYGSLEACQRLVEAGIVLETEASWCEYTKGKWDIGYTELIKESNRFLLEKRKVIPAPSMAEVWRELPDEISTRALFCDLAVYRRGINTVAQYIWFNDSQISFESTNPTDALIDLLIWVKKEPK